MPRLYANRFSTTLASNIGPAATSFDLASVSGFPTLGAGDEVILSLTEGTTNERVRITANPTGVTFTGVQRGADGSTAQTFTTAAVAQIRVTQSTVDGLRFAGGLRPIPTGQYAPMFATYAASFITNTRTLNRLDIYPVPIAEATTVTALGTYLSTPDSTNADAVFRFGIWQHDAANYRAGNLVVASGTVSCFGGVSRFLEGAVTTTVLQPGIYWVGAVAQGTANTASIGSFGTGTAVHQIVVPRATAPDSGTLFNQMSGASYNSITGALGNLGIAPSSYTGVGPVIWFKG